MRIKNTGKLLDRAWRHEEADNLRQDFAYLEEEQGEVKGCAIGCLAVDPRPSVMRRVLDRTFGEGQRRSVKALERDFGIPRSLTLACESVFENLSPRRARTWPRRFAEALVPLEGIELTDALVRSELQMHDGDDPPEDSRPVLAFLARVAKSR